MPTHRPHYRDVRRRKNTLLPSIGIITAAFLCGTFELVLLLLLVTLPPHFTQGTYSINGQLHTLRFPFEIQTEAADIDIDIPFALSQTFAHFYTITADDCLTHLTINKIPVQNPTIPFCDYIAGRTIDLSPYLQEGENTLSARIHNNGGPASLRISIAPRDSLWLITILVIVLTVALCGLLVFALHSSQKKPTWKSFWTFVLVLGVLLRMFYVGITPPSVRAHDVGGHVEYIEYIVRHASLPPPTDGFEFYQPPLYYGIAAMILFASNHMGLPRDTALWLLQLFALLLSLLAFGIGLRIGYLLFPHQKNRWSFLFFSLLLATVPSFIFFAARINNDVLFQFLGFLALLFLLQWWRKCSLHRWFLLCMIIGLGMLSKLNAALFLPAAFGCLLFHPRIPWRSKVIQGCVGFLVVFLLCGWFYLPRALVTHDVRKNILGNVDILTNFVENSPQAFLTFNPLALLSHPFNDPFNDQERRQQFWEYFFRSALFGEFRFPALLIFSLPLLLSALILLFPALTNIITDISRHPLLSLPLWLPLLILLGGHALFRFAFPYSSSQDFRYSIPLLPLIAYYATKPLPVRHHFFLIIQRTTAVLLGFFATLFLLGLR